jgi:hypothetical protein
MANDYRTPIAANAASVDKIGTAAAQAEPAQRVDALFAGGLFWFKHF